MRLLVCTHAHSDHYGQAATIIERAGCELWMHPNHEHMTRRGAGSRRGARAPHRGRAPERRARGAAARLRRRRARARAFGIAGIVEPDRDLLPGVEIDDRPRARWQVIETPGHAPSHVCLYQPERRILISGDHLLGRVSLYYDYGWSPDPAGEFLRLARRVEELDARLCLAGHARPFTDVQAHIEANRALVAERLGGVPAGPARARADHRVRGRPARLRRGDHRRRTRTGG